jgi:hypothetical protein
LPDCLRRRGAGGHEAFNAAVTAGDHKTASTEAREIWKTWDKSKADTAFMARRKHSTTR